jgi:hypothetical protein
LPSRAKDVCGFYGVNEFGEPSLIYHDGILFSARFNDVIFDEYGKKIEGEIERPILAAIENGEALGFKDGDILVQQDDWTWWRKRDYVFEGLEIEPQSNIDHYFKVLRFNEVNKEYDVVEINVPKGDERITQLQYKKFRVTKEEENRVYRVMSHKIYNHIFEFIPAKGKAIYERGLQSPALVLSVNGWDMSRHFGGDKDSLISELRRQKADVWKVIVYNEIQDEIQEYVLDSDTLGVKIESYAASPEYYDFLKNKIQEYKNNEN